VIEEYCALTDEAYFTNAVTEVAVAGGARLRHIKLQRESDKGFHIATCAVRVAKDATYVSQTVTLGARLSRYDLAVHLSGEGAAVALNGLSLFCWGQLTLTHTFLNHGQPNGRSAQLHKPIVVGAAHAVFNGKI